MSLRTARANYFELAPKAIEILMNQEAYLRERFSTSDKITTLTWELVKLRISQINQCAFCVDMHSKETLSQGETQERIIGLSVWRDLPLYTEVEIAALDWAEHLTFGQAVNEQYYQHIIDVLGEENLVNLTIAINAINSWNRVAKTFKPEVGSYKP